MFKNYNPSPFYLQHIFLDWDTESVHIWVSVQRHTPRTLWIEKHKPKGAKAIRINFLPLKKTNGEN